MASTSQPVSISNNQHARKLPPMIQYAIAQADQLRQRKGNEGSESGAPMLTCYHAPSNASLPTLKPITLKDLRQDSANMGKAMFLAIQSISVGNGLKLVVRDQNGEEGVVWSLIEYPFPGGKASISEGTVVAVKGPYYGYDLNGQLAVCVHHPTDIVRVSRFDEAVTGMCSCRAAEPNVDVVASGDSALIDDNLMDGVDYYSRDLKRKMSDLKCPAECIPLLIKRALAFSKLGLHQQVIKDAAAVLAADPANQSGHRLMCKSALETGSYDEARRHAPYLQSLEAESEADRKLFTRVSSRVQQASGKYDLGSLAKATTNQNMEHDVSNFFSADVELRKSSLGGRGVFARKKLGQGELLVCEKPLALNYNTRTSSFDNGLRTSLPNRTWASRDTMSFLQQLARKACVDLTMHNQLFDLFDGEEKDQDTSADRTKAFDSYRALNIIKFNAHTITRGTASTEHDMNDPSYESTNLQPPGCVTGLWYRTSLFNHSCLPSAVWSWTGDVMVVKTTRDIDADEEVTLSFFASGDTHQNRLAAMSSFNFKCSCPLCRADATLTEAARSQRDMIQSTQLRMLGKLDTDELSEVEDTVRACIRTYNTGAYKDLPYVGVAPLFFHLAHVYLGPVCDWSKATPQTKAQAYDCFVATIEIGFEIKLIKDPSSTYCELAFGQYSLTSPITVLALLGLAELSFISSEESERQRAGSLARCAKLLYGLHYGEDTTFEDRHNQYRCKMVPSHTGHVELPPDWDGIKAREATRPSLIPDHLYQ